MPASLSHPLRRQRGGMSGPDGFRLDGMVLGVATAATQADGRRHAGMPATRHTRTG